MLGYLLLSYSRVPQTLLLPALPAVCIGEGGVFYLFVYLFIYLFVYLFICFCPHWMKNFSSKRKQREISSCDSRFYFFFSSSGHIWHENSQCCRSWAPFLWGDKDTRAKTEKEGEREREEVPPRCCWFVPLNFTAEHFFSLSLVRTLRWITNTSLPPWPKLRSRRQITVSLFVLLWKPSLHAPFSLLQKCFGVPLLSRTPVDSLLRHPIVIRNNAWCIFKPEPCRSPALTSLWGFARKMPFPLSSRNPLLLSATSNFDRFICICGKPKKTCFSVSFDWLYGKLNVVTCPSHKPTFHLFFF